MKEGVTAERKRGRCAEKLAEKPCQSHREERSPAEVRAQKEVQREFVHAKRFNEEFAVYKHIEGHDGQGELPSDIVGFAYVSY